MFFELLCGVYQQTNIRTGKVETFEVRIVRDTENHVVSKAFPVVESDRDLVARFGKDKFRKLVDAEARARLSAAEQGSSSEEPTPAAEAISEVAPPQQEEETEEEQEETKQTSTSSVTKRRRGTDVTARFPKAQQLEMSVFLHKGTYTVVDATGDVLSTKPLISKEKVNHFLKRYEE